MWKITLFVGAKGYTNQLGDHPLWTNIIQYVFYRADKFSMTSYICAELKSGLGMVTVMVQSKRDQNLKKRVTGEKS